MIRLEFGVPRRQLMGQMMAAAAWLGVTAIAFWLTPSLSGHGTHTQLGLPACPSMFLLNKSCPGCGMTTSWTAMVHGDLASAFRSHALGPISYVLFTAWAGLSAWGVAAKVRLDTGTRGFLWFSILFTIAFVGYGVLRYAIT